MPRRTSVGEQGISGGAAIEVRLEKAAQLFHSMDPYPFRERDLDQNAEEFIVTWARELPSDIPLRIRIHLPKAETQGSTASDIQGAMTRYFTYRAEMASEDLKELFSLGRVYLAIGLSMLTVCTLLAQLANRLGAGANWSRVVAEGLLLLGWVANWRPAEILLFDWLPIVRRRKLLRRLAEADVEVVPV